MTYAQQGNWRADITTGEFGQLITNFTLQKNNSYLFGITKPDANKRILGGLKGSFAKGFFQRDGSMMELDSVLIENNTVTGFLILQKKKYFLQGTKNGNVITANLMGKSSGKTYGKFVATQVDLIEKPKNYQKLWTEIKVLTEENIYHKTVLEGKEWTNFVKYMDDFSHRVEDDAEFMSGFFYKSRELPFSHYSLTGNKENASNFLIAGAVETVKGNKPELKPLNESTFLLDIPAFDFRSGDIDAIMNEIVNSKAKNLIIDLRNNPGGDLEGAMRICQYLTKKTLYGGVVLSQSYWKNNQSPPLTQDYGKFKVMNNANYDRYKKEVKSGVEGLSIISEPLPKTFEGKIYILTSNVTASTSEPFAYTLQKEKIATLIGAKTAGSVLSMEYFHISNFALTIPMLDYYTFDGKRLDGIGVTPNIICEPSLALEVALQEIEKAQP